MIEPAAYGCNTAFGPETRNFRDVVQLMLENDAATQITEPTSFTDWLEQQLAAPEAGQKRGENAITLIRQQQGALKKTLDRLLELLPIPQTN